MDKAQVDWGSPVTTKPTYEELEQRIHALEKEIKDSKRRTEKLRKSDVLLSQILREHLYPPL